MSTYARQLVDPAPTVETSACFDKSGRYRFSLRRLWDDQLKMATFVMLNPSSADHVCNDATIARCLQLARFWGFGGINVVNLFAYRTSSPAHLRTIKRPVGKENNEHIRTNAENAAAVILGWGNHGSFRQRDREVLELLAPFDLWCIGTTKSGQPKHPLYAPGTVTLRRYLERKQCVSQIGKV